MVQQKWLTYIIVLTISSIFQSSLTAATPIFYDDFVGDHVSAGNWHLPTWVSQKDGTFVGRTQFRCFQNSSFPLTHNSNAVITLETYNPFGFSFYGTDLISNQLVNLSTGIHITVRAKLNTLDKGIIGGIFLYALKTGSTTLHDEIDIELMTNFPKGVYTNIYSNEEHGKGRPEYYIYNNGSITDYHIYEIIWLPNKVSWFVDGSLVRTNTSNVPTGPMYFHLNLWAAGKEWPETYGELLQPAVSEQFNKVFSMVVDYVYIESFNPTSQEN